MTKKEELARSIIQIASCVALPLEERVEMIKASAKQLLKEMVETEPKTVKEILEKK